MHYYAGTTYSQCRSGSDSGLHRRNFRRDPEPFDSGDSTLSELDESESGSGSGQDIDPNLPYPGIAPIALRYLSQTTRPRSWCLALISNPWFERISMMVILLNCVTLGMYQPCMDDKCETNRCKILQLFDDFIFAFFALEMTIKMIAMGVYGRGSYLADSWNRLDLFIVLAGAIEYGLNVDNLNLSAVRTIRVLRPLRAINRIPSMRILVMLLLDTLPMLGNVLLLCFFVFFIFGIVGVQLWQGILRQRCYLTTELNNLTEQYNFILPNISHIYKLDHEQEYICTRTDGSGMHACSGLLPFENGSHFCNLTVEQKYNDTRFAHNDDVCINWNLYYTNCTDKGPNPFQGTISFDNIGLAWVSIFLVISLEGWTDIMYFIQDAHSFWDWIYFVLLIVIGSFFMINLCLVVIATQFSETKKREMERMRLERARFQSSSTLASSTNNSEPTSCYAEMVKYIAHLWRRSKRRLLKKIRLYRVRQDQRRDRKMIAGETIRLNYAKRHHPNCPRHRTNPASVPSTRVVSRASSICLSDNPQRFGDEVELQAVSKRSSSLLRVPSVSNQEIAVTNNNDSPTNLLSPPIVPNNRRRSSVMFSDVVVLHDNSPPSSSSNLLPVTSNIDKKNVCSSEKTTQAGDGNIWQISSFPNQQEILQTQQQIAQDCYELMNGEAMTCQELLALGAINAAGQIVADTFLNSLTKGISNRNNRSGEEYVQQLPEDDFACCQDLWHCESEYKNEKRSRLYIVSCLILKGFIRGLKWCRKMIQLLVEHRHFQRAILLAILINTMSMGIEHHQQPVMLTTAVEISNVIFSALFAVEMLLKVIAEGPFGYISNGFNVFDGIIVILSGIELFQRFLGQSHTDSGLSVLRTFRLLRILKLVRFMPNLRRQLFVMLRTMDNVAIFFSLLILFIFIFSILGMYLFGGKFCNYKTEDGTVKECTCHMIITKDERCECDRKHFNNILWATVTVFQILTQEDWNIVLSNGMAKTSHWAALYFVALMTFGNYVLFNLLVAILVEGFSSERNERREREQRELARRKMSCMLDASLGGSSDETSRSASSSNDSYRNHRHQQEAKNSWRSADDLRKGSNHHCNCRDKDCCYLDVQAGIEPKCNIQKESLARQSPRQTSPPIITHTAATPQDSPSTTLDDFPEFRYNVTVTSDHQSASDSSPGGVSSTESTQKTSSLSLLKPPTLSPPPVNFRQFERPLDEPHQSAKIVTHNERIGSKTMTFSEKVSPIVPAKSEQKGQPEKGKIQRKCSWKLTNPRKPKNRSGSDSEATVPLNNGRDHSQCNGGGISRQASLRNDSLLQSTIRIQNDTQSDAPNNRSANNNNKGFSPQNSIRCRSNTYSVPQVSAAPALTRHNSLATSTVASQKFNKCSASPSMGRKNEPKSVNSLNDKTMPQERTLPRVRMDECAPNNNGSSGRSSPRISRVKKLLILLEPTGFMKEKDEYSLYTFPPNNKFRQWCTWFVTQKWFDNAILLFIAMNCITLAMERPNIPQGSTERYILSVCNYIFTVVFTIEMFVKVVSTGMCYGPNAYFTSGWNIMDGFLVIISIVDLLMTLIGESSPRIFGILRVFRLLRSLRPLRVINRAPGLKLVVQTLLSSLRPIGNIVLICCTFFIIFGILGVQLFKGSFWYCKGSNLTGILNRNNCISKGYDWKNQKYNFDDLGQALMSLFVLSSRDGWVNIMYNGLDAVGEDMQPITNYNEWRLLYFIAFILLVGFFVLNMFVGVVVENFHRCREEQEKEERVRRAAKRALQLEKRRKRMNQPPYYINYAPWRLFIHNVVTSKYFDLAIAAVIGLNVVTMATESYRMPDILSYILRIFNYFFTAVFILESTMKLIALGVLLYIKDRWNLLDVAIVILSVVGIVLEELKTKIIPINPTVLRVMRVMRIARVLKLLKMAKGIRALLDTVMQALPQVGNLGLLFFLLFFIFAALGVELFGRLDCEKIACQGLGEHAHFQNFGMAFLTLFRVATGDNWNGIMKDTLTEEGCSKSEDCVTNCCVSKIIAPVFFVIFVLMAQFVLVNVVVAVLMKHLEESHKHLEDEQDMDNQLEREFAEKQEMEERRELCLALQMDQECQRQRRPLAKVLSLPADFTYNPPGHTRAVLERRPSFNRTRRQTLHSHQPLQMPLNVDDIRSIDESLSDIYSIRECDVEKEQKMRQIQANLDEIISLGSGQNQGDALLKVPRSDERFPLKRINETNENNRLLVVPESSNKPLTISRLYGSTKHLFSKQKSTEITEETPFLSVTPAAQDQLELGIENIESSSGDKDLKIPKHDSQESVQRIIKERRKLDDYKEFNEFDIFDVTHSSEENLVEDDEDDEQRRDKTITDSGNENQC